MDTRLARIITSSLWAILPDAIPFALARLTMFDATDATGGTPRWEAAKPSMRGTGANKVAVIPIQGVLSKDGPSYFGSSYDGITSAVEQAGADPDVKHVILSVDSPGGQVTGLPETAAAIANLAKIKPVSAIVEGTSASAAYWLTSQAHNITLTPSGEVGSVGVRMMHVDMSAALEKAGLKVTELQAGEYKTEWSPYKALTDEAAGDMQSRLNATHEDFLGAVAAGRGTRATTEIAANRYGEGRMFSANDAHAHGLVDNVQSARDFYKAAIPATEAEAQPRPQFPLRARLEIERARLG